MGVSRLIRLIRTVIKYTISAICFIFIITLIPNVPPYTTFSSIDINNLQPQVGELKLNDAINNVKPLYKDKLLGPETFQLLNNELYTSVATGEIVKISPGGHVTFVTKIGKPCNGLANEHVCGRPLGFEIDEKKNLLYICDAYYGIWKVDIKTDKKTLLVSPHVKIEGATPKLFNSLALSKSGDFYWTDSSSDYQLKDGTMTLLSDPSGRVFHYNAAKNESRVIMEKLWFPNGVVLSPNEQFLVIAETFHLRLVRYYLYGPNRGKTDVFVEGLPGTPDVLRVLPDGSGILAGLYTVVDAREPFIIQSLAKAPIFRQFLARVLRVTEIGFEYLNTLFPNVVFEDIIYKIGHFQMLSSMSSKLSGLAYIDWNGKILKTYYNTDGSVKSISDAIVFNNKLLTGAPHGQNFIGSVPVPPELQKAFASTKSSNPPVQKAPKVDKPAESKPKTKATPKPQEAKTTQKPVAAQVTTPKPVETKPSPKATTPKPEQATTIKPEQAKTTQKPVAAKPNPKPVDPQPTLAPATKPAETKPLPKQDSRASNPKSPERKTETKPIKENTQTTTSSPKPEKPKDDKAAKQKPVKENKAPRKVPEVVPIVEDIPSDTAKPTKEKLKVIRKEGPAEIPNPNL